MKIRNLLMTVAFVLAVTSTFAIKAKAKRYGYFSYKLGTTCTVIIGNTDPVECNESYTGTQCTVSLHPVYFYDTTGSPPPTCTIPMRRL